MAYPKIMGSLLESMWSQRGVIATLAYGSGLSEWDLAESTPGTREYLHSLSGHTRRDVLRCYGSYTGDQKVSPGQTSTYTYNIHLYREGSSNACIGRTETMASITTFCCLVIKL